MPPAAQFDANVKLVLDRRAFLAQVEVLVDDIAQMTGIPIKDVERMGRDLGWYKQKPSGGIKDAAVAGGVAGVAAALTLKLIESINNWVKQSKIVGVFFDTVGKAMGLLVDLILLPFLPILIWVMITLFQSVINFGKLWREITVPLTKAIEAILNPPPSTGKYSFAGIDWTKETAGIAYAILAGIIVGITALIASGAAGTILAGIVTAIFTALGAIAASTASLIILAAIATAILAYLGWQLGLKIADFLYPAVVSFKGWLWSVGELLENWETDWNNNILTLWGNVPQWWEDNVAGPLWNSLTKLETALEGVRDSIGNFINSVVLIFKQVWWGIQNMLNNNQFIGWAIKDPGEYPTAATGGRVARTGLAVIHKGEDIVPGGKGITVNIYGTYQNDEDLYKKFIDKLRRDQWRQNV